MKNKTLISTTAAILLALTACGQQRPSASHAGTGALTKLKPEKPGRPVPPVSFIDANAVAHPLSAFRGRYVLLNLWATWCAPCVRELPALSHLQAAVGPERLSVVPVSVGRDTAIETTAFLKQHKAMLPVYIDAKSAFLHAFGAFGLPLTVMIDPEGHEVARASGAIRWDAKDSISYFEKLKNR